MADITDPALSVVPYDWLAGSDPARTRLPALGPTLDRINDRFARHLRATLLQHLRRGLAVTPAKVEAVKYKELVEALDGPALLTLVNMKPLHGSLLFVLDSALANTIVEVRFGGSNRFPSPLVKREFTALEGKLMQRVLEMVMDQFAIAWEPFALFEPSIIRTETNRQFVSIAAADDLIFVNSFDISVDRGGGKLLVCIPDASLEPLYDQLTSTIAEEGSNYDTRWYEALKTGVEQARLTLRAQLGTLEVNVAELVKLRPGDVFEMGRPENIVLEAAGIPLFSGKWGRHGRKVAVRIEETLGTTEEG
jgi:flagellar motor switch protein FliM